MPAESAGVRAPKRAGDYRDQQSLGLLLGLVAELVPDGCEGEPVQHSGRAARAEDQLRGSDAGQVRLQDPKHVRSDLVEPGVEPTPPFWWVNPAPRHDTDHGAVATALAEGADHRPGECRRQLLERRV